jgi:hypothetical protein
MRFKEADGKEPQQALKACLAGPVPRRYAGASIQAGLEGFSGRQTCGLRLHFVPLLP